MNVRPPSIDFQSKLTVVLKPKGEEIKGAPAGVGGALFTLGLGAGIATFAELIKGSPLVAEKSTIVVWVKRMPEAGNTDLGTGASAASFCKSRTARPATRSAFIANRISVMLGIINRAPIAARALMDEEFFFIRISWW
jgi:hypothetical protein